MKNKMRKNFLSGWVLIIWIATAFLAYTAIGNYPLNILADLYGGQQVLSSIYTAASVIGVIAQLVASGYIGRMKSIKKFGAIMGLLSILALVGIMFIPGYVPGLMQMLWRVVYGLGTVLSVMYGTFALSILVLMFSVGTMTQTNAILGQMGDGLNSFGGFAGVMMMINFGYNMIFNVIAVVGVVCIILMVLFSAQHVKEKDDAFRKEAGKPLDDALANRK